MNSRIAFYVASVLLIVTVWFSTIYSPYDRQRREIHAETLHAVKKLEDFERTMRELPQFLEQANNLELFKRQLNSSLYAKEDILGLFRTIGDDAAEHNLILKEISPPVQELLNLNRNKENLDDPQFLNVVVELNGQYLDFAQYIRHLESSPYFRAINFCLIHGQKVLGPRINISVSIKALIGFTGETP